MKSRNVIISEGNRPFWQLVIAAIHYTAIFFLLFFFFTKFEFTTNTKKLKGSFGLLELALFLIPSALAFSLVRNFLFDLEQKRYKIEYCIGPIRFGKWQQLPEIEYVSVFKQPKADGDYIFEVNLWYSRNQHFNIYENTSLESAFLMGKNVAKVLEVKLLDATVANNFKWTKLD